MRALESLRAVRIRIGVASIVGSARTARTRSSPLILGIMKSQTMRSGLTERASSSPSAPSSAAWIRKFGASASHTNRFMSALSSMTRT